MATDCPDDLARVTKNRSLVQSDILQLLRVENEIFSQGAAVRAAGCAESAVDDAYNLAPARRRPGCRVGTAPDESLGLSG